MPMLAGPRLASHKVHPGPGLRRGPAIIQGLTTTHQLHSSLHRRILSLRAPTTILLSCCGSALQLTQPSGCHFCSRLVIALPQGPAPRIPVDEERTWLVNSLIGTSWPARRDGRPTVFPMFLLAPRLARYDLVVLPCGRVWFLACPPHKMCDPPLLASASVFSRPIPRPGPAPL